MHKLYDFMEARERLNTVITKTKLIHSSVFSKETGNDVYIKPENLQRTGSFKLRGAYNKIAKLTEEEKRKGVIAEVLEELPDADIILVPLGGGGLISGIALAAKLKNPVIKIIGVEPEGAASAIAALKNGEVVELPETNTIADGTAVRKIGELNFDYIKNYVDDIITISDYELMESFLLLVEKHKIVAENAGVLSVAALRKINEKGKKIVSILSGGNIDVLTISSMINKGLIVRGRIFRFSVNLPDKPGQLVAVSQILSEQNANVIRLEHNQFKNLNRFHDVELQVTVETNGEEHIKRIIEKFNEKGYVIERLNSQEIE